MPRRDIGLRAELSELVAMLRAYVVQETVGPLRGLGRYVLFGVLGAIALCFAVVLAALALMRVLQNETSVFDANWSFVPHLAGAAVLLLAIAVLVRVMRSGQGGAAESQRDERKLDDPETERSDG